MFPLVPPWGQSSTTVTTLRTDECLFYATLVNIFCSRTPDFLSVSSACVEVDASTRFHKTFCRTCWLLLGLFHVLCLLTYRLQSGSAGSCPVVHVSSPAVWRDSCCHICIFTAFTPQLLLWIENSSPSLPVLPKSSPHPILPPLPSVPDLVLPQWNVSYM